mmetsp:Transcript_1870/g.6165  ORF Transcript_1870/g.6165 Transcript_1870/m.6165 type:complete len:456 (-) Transcript_1870:162-1529(-)
MQGGSGLLPNPPVQGSREHSISSNATAASSGEARRAERGRGKTWLLDSKYVLGEELGRGSSGRVYRALNQGGGGSHFVAIKEIPVVGMSDAAARAVESEVELMRNLSHPQIIRFYETIRTEHHLYLVLEYVENGSLASILKTFGRLPEHMLIVYMRQVLAGLEWLHAQGVCHRDIKGANLLITKDGQVKLADFGVAGRVDASAKPAAEQAGAPVGTPYWMAPEIIQMEPFTTASDIWSLGCTVLELLTGEPPYFELRPVNALYRIVHDSEPPIPETVGDDFPLLNDFLLRCFDRDPKTRASACALRQHEWLQQEVSPSHINMPPPVLADGRRESGAAAFARLAVLESIDKPRSIPRTNTGERSVSRTGSGVHNLSRTRVESKSSQELLNSGVVSSGGSSKCGATHGAGGGTSSTGTNSAGVAGSGGGGGSAEKASETCLREGGATRAAAASIAFR